MNIEPPRAVSHDVAQAINQGLVASGQTLDEADLNRFVVSLCSGDGTILGGCIGEIAFRSARVSELWVHADLRGGGWGTKLLAAAEAHARANNCQRIHIETRNSGAKRLYERCGFEVFGELPNYHGEESLWYLTQEFAGAT